MSDKDKFLKAAKLFRECGDIYEQLGNMYDEKDTQENQEKIESLAGKLMFKLVECQELAL